MSCWQRAPLAALPWQHSAPLLPSPPRPRFPPPARPPAVVTAFLAAWAWHLRLALRGGRWLHLSVYLGSRLAVYAYFIASVAALTSSGEASFHLHHLYLGWAAAIWAEFDHWASGLLLAVGAAVFVQVSGCDQKGGKHCWTCPQPVVHMCKAVLPPRALTHSAL